MTTTPPEAGPRTDLIAIVLRGWWAIGLTMIVAAGAAFVMARATSPSYTAAATSIVIPNPSLESDSALISSVQGLEKRSIVSTYAEILLSSQVLRQAAQSLGIASTEGYVVDATVLLDSNVLEITVDGPDAAATANLANTIVAIGATSFETLYPVYAVSPLDAASTPVEPSEPQPLRDAIAAAALGLILGVGVAALLEARRKRLRRRFDLVEFDVEGPLLEVTREGVGGRVSAIARDRAE